MTGMSECRDVRQALGAYVLGAVEPAERAAVEEHLAGCVACREELAGLAGLPALLRRVPAAEAERLTEQDWAVDRVADSPPSDQLLTSLLARVVQTRRARRWRAVVATAAAVTLALGTGVTGALVAHAVVAGSKPAATATLDTWRTVSGTGAGSGVGVTVKYAATAWGTTMAVQVSGMVPGTACQFQVTDAQGHTWVLGRWHVGYGSGVTWYPVATSVPASGLRAFQVVTGGKVVASVPVRA